jgi:hypothetical protein
VTTAAPITIEVGGMTATLPKLSFGLRSVEQTEATL